MSSEQREKSTEPTLAPPVLEYAQPEPGITATRIFAALCSIPMGLLCPLFFLNGVMGFAQAIGEQHNRYRDEDICKGACGLLIGLICLWAAVRWGRAGFLGQKNPMMPRWITAIFRFRI